MKIEPNCILIFVIDKNENILLLNRENEPAKGTWCGVGGYIEKDETIYDCAKRELHEETGIKTNKFKLLGKYDKIKSYIFVLIVNDLKEIYKKDLIKTKEGILSIKKLRWTLENNEGIVEETRNALNFVINKLGGNKNE